MKTLVRTSVQWVVFVLAASYLTACSVDVTGEGAPPPPPDLFGGKPRVSGPKADSEWTTSCYARGIAASGRLSLSIQGDKFVRSTESFEDAYCQVSKGKTSYSGTFIYTEKFPDGSYAVNYAIDLGQGVTQFAEERLLLDGEMLFLSNSLISGSDTPVDRSQPLRRVGAWFAAECENYAGKYQMNSELFEITQKGCEMLVIKSEAYLLDGVERTYRSGKIKAVIQDKIFKREYRNTTGEAVLEKWSFQTRPCQLSNPSGEKYLTREAWINGVYSYDSCDFYSKTKN